MDTDVCADVDADVYAGVDADVDHDAMMTSSLTRSMARPGQGPDPDIDRPGQRPDPKLTRPGQRPGPVNGQRPTPVNSDPVNSPAACATRCHTRRTFWCRLRARVRVFLGNLDIYRFVSKFSTMWYIDFACLKLLQI